MNYQQARIFLYITILLVVLLFGWLIFRPKAEIVPIVESSEPTKELPVDTTAVPRDSTIKALNISARVGNLALQFADLNPDHLVYAQKIGIKPIRSSRDILRISRPIVEVKTNDNFFVDNLSHSYPYLVPEAAELLDTIGARFNAKLAAQGGGHYRIKVTSLLRTSESVNRLKRGNVNSTENSAHLYGTTFDISYVGFHENHLNIRRHTDGELKNLLAEVLLELREEGKCLVKFERKQGCFHITATGK